MSAHELARRLLLMDDLEVMATDCVAYRDIGFSERVITEQDADDHGDCSYRVGERVIIL
jgi:hypothetical protein